MEDVSRGGYELEKEVSGAEDGLGLVWERRGKAGRVS